MADLSPMDLAAFWSRVEGSTSFQCWPWRGQKTESGYGRFRGHMAHRVAFELVNGPIPDGAMIRHHCDNPPCCNPLHLAAGTAADNSRDAVARNRLATGERSGKTRFTTEQIIYIKTNPDHITITEMARRLGAHKSTISYIRSGRSWKMVGLEGIAPPPSAMSKQRSPTELQALSGSGEPDTLSETTIGSEA